MQKRFKIFCIPLLCALLFLNGCGTDNSAEKASASEASAAAAQSENAEANSSVEAGGGVGSVGWIPPG